MADNLYWIWLAEALGAGSSDLEPLLTQFGSPYDIFSAGEDAYYRIPGVSEKTVERLCRAKGLEHAEAIMDQCIRLGVGVLTYADEAYPSLLRALTNPPAVLYYRGHLPQFEKRVRVAVVGTRSMTEYGSRTAYKIGYELASAGVIVVSGMALGIDSVAQAGALAAGGETIAVLGSGVDVIYPAQHRALYDRIAAHGAVISEYPPGTRAVGSHFPVRNRIISGLSQGTLVVEADRSSGAMITARTALAQGRDLFAVPGQLNSFHSAGTNDLLHAGANLVLTANDILQNYTFLYRNALNMPAYAASVAHSELDPAVLDEYGVSARSSDFKQRTPKAEPPPPPPMPERTPKPTPVEPATVKPKPTQPAPTKRTERLPGELKRPRGEKPTLKPPPAPTAPPTPVTAPKPPEKSAAKPTKAKPTGLSPTAQRIYDALPDDRAVSTDEIAGVLGDIGAVIIGLTELELEGLVNALPGDLYLRLDR